MVRHWFAASKDSAKFPVMPSTCLKKCHSVVEEKCLNRALLGDSCVTNERARLKGTTFTTHPVFLQCNDEISNPAWDQSQAISSTLSLLYFISFCLPSRPLKWTAIGLVFVLCSSKLVPSVDAPLDHGKQHPML